jgi:thiol-disulfide isomerase/thioredoxin
MRKPGGIVGHGVTALLVLGMTWPGLAATAGAHSSTGPASGLDAERLREELSRRPLPTLDGGRLAFDSLTGDVVVVHFWATWCRPCQRELPALNELNAEIAPKGGRVVAIAIDQDRRNVTRFAREHALTLPIVPDGPDGLAHRLQLNALPCTVVLDRAGRVALIATGTGEAAIDHLRSTTRGLVASPAPPATADAGVTR